MLHIWRLWKEFLGVWRETVKLGLKDVLSQSGTLIGFSDADWAGDQGDRHSTTGNVFLLSGGDVSWLSKKETPVSLSTADAEHVVLSQAAQ